MGQGFFSFPCPLFIEVFMKTLIKIWKFLDGRKTIIGEFLLLLLFQPFIKNLFSVELHTMLMWIVGTLTGASLVHHIKKEKKK